MSLILRAADFARRAHHGTKRKYNGAEYITHPARVAGRVAVHPLADEPMVAAAFLHDVVEDTPFNIADLTCEFGSETAFLVDELTNPTKGSKAPRAERKALDREHIKGASNGAAIIKLIDRIDNLREMKADADKVPADFRKLYLSESRLLLNAIGPAADHLLFRELRLLIDEMESTN